MELRPLGAIVAEMMSYTIRRCYGSNIENDWYIGGYILPGNVQKVILKSKALPTLRSTGREAARAHHNAGSPRSGAASAAGDVAVSAIFDCDAFNAGQPLRRKKPRKRAVSLENGGSDGARTRDLRRDRPTL